MQMIIKNAIQCKLCGDIIESTDRHNYVECKCGACAVDGGHDSVGHGAPQLCAQRGADQSKSNGGDR